MYWDAIFYKYSKRKTKEKDTRKFVRQWHRFIDEKKQKAVAVKLLSDNMLRAKCHQEDISHWPYYLTMKFKASKLQTIRDMISGKIK